MPAGKQNSPLSAFLKGCASVCVTVFSVAKDAVMSLPLFFSALLGVGFPIRGTDADPDPPKPANAKSPGDSVPDVGATERQTRDRV
jgi:hypothetical protein